MIIALLLKLLALYMGGIPLCAQTVAATSLLSQGPGAEAAALGGSVVSIVADPTALYWNPAGLAYSGGAISGEHLFLFDGARYDFVGLSVPSKIGTFGLGALQLNRGDIVARTTIDDPGNTVSNTQTDYLLGFGRSLTEHWSAGAAVNVLDFNIAGYSDKGWGVDLGTQGSYAQEELFGLKRLVWTFGAAIKNLIEPKLTLMEDEESFPTELHGGIGVSFQTASRPSLSGVLDHDRVMALLSLKRVFGQPGLNPGLGLSYTYQNFLVFRLGYDGYFSTGVGIRTSDGKFTLDYSVSNKPLSIDNRFTLAYRFLAPKTKPREIFKEEIDDEYTKTKAQADAFAYENYAAGQTYFKDQKYREAQESFRLAAFLAPENKEMSSAWARAKEAFRRDGIRILLEEKPFDPDSGQESNAFKDIAELLDLQADNKDAIIAAVPHVEGRITLSAYSKVFEPRLKEARKLLSLGHVFEAQAMGETLDILKEPQTASAVDSLKHAIEAGGVRVRREFDGLSANEKDSTDAQLVQAALALKRAFPEDSDAAQKADGVLSRYRAENPLTIKERFYLRKLYYLAAIAYVKKATSDEIDNVVADLAEIRRQDPADSDADALYDAIARDGLVQ